MQPDDHDTEIPTTNQVTSSVPLIVDLDGTLLNTDTLHESAIKAIKGNPLLVFQIIVWLSKGKAYMKSRLAEITSLDPATLPWNHSLVEWLKVQKNSGRQLVLSTATDESIASKIASYLGLFSEVISSDGITNNAGTNKAGSLTERFGEKQFDYAGNSSVDIAIWQKARHAIVVNASASTLAQAKSCSTVEHVFDRYRPGFRDWNKVFRFHQWLKNSLLIVPIAASHKIFDIGSWTLLLFAFVAFGMCASSVYIVNDLLDLDSDRAHPRKKLRPFANGKIPVITGCILAPVFLLSGFMTSLFVNRAFTYSLLAYFLLTTAYSLYLKRLVLLDCLTLAVLYTLRIIAGAMALGHALSFWLLAFSAFLFLSLAFVKRYAEFSVQKAQGNDSLHGRGYHTDDAPIILMMGVVSGYTAVLVLALYLNSETVIHLYKTPELIWSAIPVMLFWISWMWLQTHRNNMHDDPLVFAVKDKASLISGIIFALIMALGAIGLP